jgi:peptidoglycan/LPS O-acetylase OafA/YrhL
VSALASPWITKLGAASYSLYLLHQNVGITLISAASRAMGVKGLMSVLVALVIAAGLALASMTIYDHFEKPTRRHVTRYFLDRWNAKTT